MQLMPDDDLKQLSRNTKILIVAGTVVFALAITYFATRPEAEKDLFVAQDAVSLASDVCDLKLNEEPVDRSRDWRDYETDDEQMEVRVYHRGSLMFETMCPGRVWGDSYWDGSTGDWVECTTLDELGLICAKDVSGNPIDWDGS